MRYVSVFGVVSGFGLAAERRLSRPDPPPATAATPDPTARPGVNADRPDPVGRLP